MCREDTQSGDTSISVVHSCKLSEISSSRLIRLFLNEHLRPSAVILVHYRAHVEPSYIKSVFKYNPIFFSDWLFSAYLYLVTMSLPFLALGQTRSWFMFVTLHCYFRHTSQGSILRFPRVALVRLTFFLRCTRTKDRCTQIFQLHHLTPQFYMLTLKKLLSIQTILICK